MVLLLTLIHMKVDVSHYSKLKLCFFLIFFSTHFSFSFAFFVHGESTVCASMDVRVHPLVRNLTHQHILQAQASSSGIPGIFAFVSGLLVVNTMCLLYELLNRKHGFV